MQSVLSSTGTELSTQLTAGMIRRSGFCVICRGSIALILYQRLFEELTCLYIIVVTPPSKLVSQYLFKLKINFESGLTNDNTTERFAETLIQLPISKLIKHDFWNSDVIMKLFNKVTSSYLVSNYKSRHLDTIFRVQIASLR